MNDPLYGNKVAFCVLSAGLLMVGLPLLADSMFGGGGHHGGSHGDAHAEVFPQFPVEIQLAATDSGAPEPKMDLGAMMSTMEPSKGERAALVCKSCHTFEQGGTHLQGPNLWNVVGRPVASASGFGSYSSAIQAAGGDWTYERLDSFLKNSQEYLPGSAMVQRIRKDDKRVSILVYLSTLSDNPVPFPAPLAEQLDAPDDHAAEDHSE